MKKLFFGALAMVLGVLCMGLYMTTSTVKTEQNWVFYDANGEQIWADRPYYQTPSNIPDTFKNRLISIEDQAFSSHIGVDFGALARATRQYMLQKPQISGGSTITMQTAKLLYLPSQTPNVWYKAQQIVTALGMEARYSKEEILEMYLNRAYFGQGAQGIFEASHRYFQTPPHMLSTGQQAVLIGLLPYPEAWNPMTAPAIADEKRMLFWPNGMRLELLSSAEYAYWKSTSITLHPAGPHPVTAPHFVQWVRDRIASKTNPKTPTLHVHTTLDADLYRAALGIAKTEIEAQAQANIHDAAIIVLDENNAVKVMVGGVNFFENDDTGHLNGTLLRRQTGSVLKPFLYGLAIEKGMSPASAIRDVSHGYAEEKGVYRPRNFDPEAEYGVVRMREALVNSYNMGAVELLSRVGNAPFLALLHDMGLPPQNENTLGLTSVLGTVEASLMEVTRAYSTLGQGKMQPIQFYTHVTDAHQQPLFSADGGTASPAPLGISARGWLSHALADRATRWRVFGQGNVLELPFDAAVKTGTSQSFRDNYSMGYTPEFTVGVWVGNADGQPLYTGSGIAGAGPIWHHVMLQLHGKNNPTTVPMPADRTAVTMCRRPEQVHPQCSELMTEFLTQAEHAQLQQVATHFVVQFPANGEVLSSGEPFLVRTNGAGPGPVQVFLQNEPQPHGPLRLAPGVYSLHAKQGNDRTLPVVFTVE